MLQRPKAAQASAREWEGGGGRAVHDAVYGDGRHARLDVQHAQHGVEQTGAEVAEVGVVAAPRLVRTAAWDAHAEGQGRRGGLAVLAPAMMGASTHFFGCDWNFFDVRPNLPPTQPRGGRGGRGRRTSCRAIASPAWYIRRLSQLPSPLAQSARLPKTRPARGLRVEVARL